MVLCDGLQLKRIDSLCVMYLNVETNTDVTLRKMLLDTIRIDFCLEQYLDVLIVVVALKFALS